MNSAEENTDLDGFLREARAINQEMQSIKRKLSNEEEDSNKRNKLNDKDPAEKQAVEEKLADDDCEIVEKIVPLIEIKDESDDLEASQSNRVVPDIVEKQENEKPETSSENEKTDTTCPSVDNSANSAMSSVSAPSPVISSDIKQEIPSSSSDSTESTADIPSIPVVVPSVKQEPSTVVKEEASSSTREICKYGVRCYRRGNPNHNRDMAHPGDSDYKLPNYPEPPKGVPSCPFGMNCYRRNPLHFQQFSHSNSEIKPKREKKVKVPMVDYGDLDSDDEENEDFSDDSMDEFIVSDGGDLDDDEDTGVETDCAEEE